MQIECIFTDNILPLPPPPRLHPMFELFDAPKDAKRENINLFCHFHINTTMMNHLTHSDEPRKECKKTSLGIHQQKLFVKGLQENFCVR